MNSSEQRFTALFGAGCMTLSEAVMSLQNAQFEHAKAHANMATTSFTDALELYITGALSQDEAMALMAHCNDDMSTLQNQSNELAELIPLQKAPLPKATLEAYVEMINAYIKLRTLNIS